MSQRYVIANWKMQLDEPQSESLAREVVRLWGAQAAAHPDVSVVLCPSHFALEQVVEACRGTGIAVGAQDCFWEDKGAYTGEVSPLTLRQLGCEWCLVGHSERRGHLGETDEMVNKKTLALLRNGINPIVCVGETREEREGGRRDSVVMGQVTAALKGASPVGTQCVVIAYEPRWVIGTGQAVSPDDAASMHHIILQCLLEQYPADVVERQFAVVYGGSVDAANFPGFLAFKEIEGALVGNTALKPAEFVKLAEAAADAR